jgi:hypothetical protein
MDRREVHDIEAQLRDARELPLGVGERAVALGIPRLRPRKHLVPGRERRAYWIDRNEKLARVLGQVIARGVLRDQGEERGVERRPRAVRDGDRGVAEHLRCLRE